MALAACSPTPAPPDALWVNNSTTLIVDVLVNGASVRSASPRSQQSIQSADLPRLPWSIELRTQGGRVLASLTVREGDVQETMAPDGSHVARGDAVRVDLSCGRLDVWVGPPLLGPAPGPGTPGDCAP
jgi:hypothetical protein